MSRGGKVIHGSARRGEVTRTYRAWSSMLARCYIPSATGYDQYGAAGVTVCDRWRNSFQNFLADMGEVPPGMSLERKENSKGYERGNCEWATRQKQNENRGSVRWIEADGIKLTATGWAKRLGIDKRSMYERLDKWPLRQALGLEPRPPQVRVPPPITEEARRKMSEAAIARVARNGGRVIG